MAASGSNVADVAYIGFVLGHGGDALQMLDLAHGMHGDGVAVRIIVPELESSISFKQRCDDLGIDCTRSPLITATLEGARQNPIAVGRLLRSVREPIVHFHTGNSCLPRVVMVNLVAQRFRRSFVTLHSPYETIEPGSLRARFWAVTARQRMAAVVSPSYHGSRFQRRCGIPDRLVTTIPNAIDVETMGRGDAAVARRQLGVGPDVPLVVFTSRLDGQKRPLEAVRIFAAVADDVPAARLVFVGRGEEHGAIVAEAARLGVSERVDMAGYQTNVPDWLAAATVWLLPTERENFSVAVLEAMAAGCAVLSTTCYGNDEVLVDGENARTFAVGDVLAAQRMLRELLADDAQRRSLGAAARELASTYSVANMVAQYRRLYRRTGDLPASLRGEPSASSTRAITP
jgi:glycosyltransferase involved in cell wall biosynthesis